MWRVGVIGEMITRPIPRILSTFTLWNTEIVLGDSYLFFYLGIRKFVVRLADFKMTELSLPFFLASILTFPIQLLILRSHIRNFTIKMLL